MTTRTTESYTWVASAGIGDKCSVDGTSYQVVQSIRTTGTVDIELDPSRTHDVVVNTQQGTHVFECIVGFRLYQMDMADTKSKMYLSRRVSFVTRKGFSITETLFSAFRFNVVEREKLKPGN